MPGDAWTIPRVIARRRRVDPEVRGPGQRRRRDHLGRARRRQPGAGAPSGRSRGEQGRPGRPADAERDRVGDGRARGDAHRRGPGPAQHAAPAPRAARPAAHRLGQPSRHGPLLPRPLVPRRPSLRSHRRSSITSGAARATPRCRRCAGSGSSDELPDALAATEHRRSAGGRRPPRRRHGHPVHLGQPRCAEGRDPHARQRAPGDGSGPRGALHRRRRAAVHPDAVLLDGRLLRRAALGAARGRDAPDGVHAGAGAHHPLPGARARDPVPRLAGPGGSHRRPPRVRHGRSRFAAPGEPAGGPAGRSGVRGPGRARTSSA